MSITNNMMIVIAICSISLLFSIIQTVEATGGAGQIKELIDPLIDNTLKALENNNTDLAEYYVSELKKELNDTFEADKEEKD